MADARGRVERVALPNGAVVLVVVDATVPTFAATLTVEAGSRYDPVGRSGLASLASSLLVEGEGAGEIAFRFEPLGASVDVATGYETTTLGAVGLGEHCADAVGLLAEMIRFRSPAVSIIRDARRRQLTEIAEEDNEPSLVCRREFFRLVFGGHPRGLPVEGDAVSLGRISRADVSEFMDTRWSPAGAVLAVSGDVEAPRVIDAACRAMESWKASDAAVSSVTPPPPRAFTGRRFVEMEREQAHVSLGGIGIARSDPLYHAAAVMDVILGDSAGFGSRLATRVREEEGLAYVIESDTAGTAGIDPGLFWAYTAASPDHVEQAVAGIVDEMRKMRSEPPTSHELESAVAYLSGRHALDRETNDARAAALVRMERYGLGLDYGDRYASLVRAVTRGDVLALARRVIDPDDYSIVAVGPASTGLFD